MTVNGIPSTGFRTGGEGNLVLIPVLVIKRVETGNSVSLRTCECWSLADFAKLMSQLPPFARMTGKSTTIRSDSCEEILMFQDSPFELRYFVIRFRMQREMMVEYMA